MPPVEDTYRRPLSSLRLSVTDRCNLRCTYCMPEEEYSWLPKSDVLTFEESSRLVAIFAGMGVKKLRLTGGEPLLRRDLDRLVARLAAIDGIEEIALTTNGVHLAAAIADLRAAGIDRITVSLDTLKRDRFLAITRRDELAQTLEGIRSVRAAGYGELKIDTVMMRGRNDDEIIDLLDFARAEGAEIRFIEYMDVGGATQWRPEDVFPRTEILRVITEHRGPVREIGKTPRAPADRFLTADGQAFGIIASTTTPFCDACDRARLTADGRFFMCLYAPSGLDLRAPLRSGASDASLAQTIAGTWAKRTDRGAVDRLLTRERGAFMPREALRSDPHLEMHTRGG